MKRGQRDGRRWRGAGRKRNPEIVAAGSGPELFFSGFTEKIAAFRPPCCVCWQMQRRLLPPAPCVRRGMTMLCHLRAVCSPSSTMYVAHGHVRHEARAHRPSTWRSRCCSAPARHKRQFFFSKEHPRPLARVPLTWWP